MRVALNDRVDCILKRSQGEVGIVVLVASLLRPCQLTGVKIGDVDFEEVTCYAAYAFDGAHFDTVQVRKSRISHRCDLVLGQLLRLVADERSLDLPQVQSIGSA